MNAFKDGQRIMVTDGDLNGMTGTVKRIKISNRSAWVKMDKPIPDEMQSFPDKDDPRYNSVVLWPEDCRELKQTPNKK